MPRRRVQIPAGAQFGRWTVQGPADPREGLTCWKVMCTCGETAEVLGTTLRRGLSSGCKSCAFITHGMTGTPTYRIWCGVIQRCTNPKNSLWEDYGGRGITVCKRWREFENFLADMGERPEGLELDREKNHLGYSKANCRWVTRKVNCRNKRNNRTVVYKGTSMTLTEAAERSGINKGTLLSRLMKNDGQDLFRKV